MGGWVGEWGGGIGLRPAVHGPGRDSETQASSY